MAVSKGTNGATLIRQVSTYGKPLGIILLVGGKERVERVVSGEDEASKVGEELAAEVEDDKEEVESNKADGGIGLGNAGGLLEVVEGRVLGQLLSLRRVSYAKPNVAVAVVGVPRAIGCGLRTSLSSWPMYCWARS